MMLKQADIGFAMGDGAGRHRDIVILNNSLTSIKDCVIENSRTMAMEICRQVPDLPADCKYQYSADEYHCTDPGMDRAVFHCPDPLDQPDHGYTGCHGVWW